MNARHNLCAWGFYFLSVTGCSSSQPKTGQQPRRPTKRFTAQHHPNPAEEPKWETPGPPAPDLLAQKDRRLRQLPARFTGHDRKDHLKHVSGIPPPRSVQRFRSASRRHHKAEPVEATARRSYTAAGRRTTRSQSHNSPPLKSRQPPRNKK